MQAEPQVVREGWLIKAPSPTNTWRFWDKQWKRRYFVLCSGHLPGESKLMWYQDDHHRRSGKSKGVINLRDCEQVDSNLSLSYVKGTKRVSYSWIFDIRVPTAKGNLLYYYFSAESEQDMNDWVRVLCHVCGLEREDNSDVSNGSERFALPAAAASTQRRDSEQPITYSQPTNPTPDNRYVNPTHPGLPSTKQWTPTLATPVSSVPPLPNRSPGTAPTPTPTVLSQLNTVPPAPFLPKPPPPPPPAPHAQQPPSDLVLDTKMVKDGRNAGTSPSKSTLGYIPLPECWSTPPDKLDGAGKNRPYGVSEPCSSDNSEMPVADPVSSDQPPNFPAPPLPVEDGVFQSPANATGPQNQQQHSRSASKDSSVSSVHLSSTESEQGENRRPSVSRGGVSECLPPGEPVLDSTSVPVSPVSPPAAVTSGRPPRSSNGSYLTDDATPPPRPPKTRPSNTSLQRPAYENDPTLNSVEEGSKFASYDTVVSKPVAFGTLPRTTGGLSGTGTRKSRDLPPTPSTSQEKGLGDILTSAPPAPLVYDHSLSLSSTGPPHPIAPAHVNGSSWSRNVSSGSSAVPDELDSTYSPFNPGPPRLVPPPTPARPCRSPSSEADSHGEQYQNFSGPWSPHFVAGPNASLERPPEVKRELKPTPRIRSPPASTGGEQLPRMPNRLADIKKGGNNNHNYEHTGILQSADAQVPQFNIERQVSFKSQKRNMIRHQTGGMVVTAAGVKSVVRNDILDAEVKVESDTQLEYVFVDTSTHRVTTTMTVTSASPSQTPSPFPRRLNRTVGVAASPGPSMISTTFSETDSSNTKIPSAAPGYVQIDPQATGAFRRAQEETSAWRDQQRTLERNKFKNEQQQAQQQSGTSIGIGGGKRK